MVTTKSKVTAKAAVSLPAKQASQGGRESSSDSDSSSSEEEEEKTSKPPVKKKPQKTAGAVAPSKPASAKTVKAEDSSSSSDDSSSEEEEEEKPKGKGTPRPQASKTSSSALAVQNGKAGRHSNKEEEDTTKAAVAVSKPGLYPEKLVPGLPLQSQGGMHTLGGWGRGRRQTTRFQSQALSVAAWAEEEETGLLSLGFCFVGSGKKRKQNEAAVETETPPAKKIKPQTPNTFPKRKKVSCLVFLSGASLIYLFI